MLYRKNFVKNCLLKSQILSEEKKPTPSSNVSLLSYQKSEQQEDSGYFKIAIYIPFQPIRFEIFRTCLLFDESKMNICAC